jgi:hypothetical protein
MLIHRIQGVRFGSLASPQGDFTTDRFGGSDCDVRNVPGFRNIDLNGLTRAIGKQRDHFFPVSEWMPRYNLSSRVIIFGSQ